MKPLRMFALAVALTSGAAFISACESPTLPPRSTTDVYDFRLRSDTFHIFHWPAGTDVRVFIYATKPARVDSMAASFERGAAMWNAYSLFGEYQLVRAQTIDEADVVVRWSDDLAPVDDSECSPTFSSGVTTFCIDDLDATPLRLATFPPLPAAPGAEGVKMLVTILASQATIPGRIDRLLAHELGHVLGIGQHSLNRNDLMYGDPVVDVLSRRDIATVQVLYHTTADVFP
ncbi:MAG: hypothetical protein ABIV28_00840 [Longimicrobiales bacterium]